MREQPFKSKNRPTVVGKAFHRTEMALKDKEIEALKEERESHYKGYLAQLNKCTNVEQDLAITKRELELSGGLLSIAEGNISKNKEQISRLNRIIDAIIKA